MEAKKLKVVICWHMHQPHYRDGLDGIYRLPWVYLHAIKDYVDMVWHLEACPEAKVVVNFAPVLLEQLDDYAQQMSLWLDEKKPMSDPLLNLVSGEAAIPTNGAKRIEIIQHCQRAHAPTMIDILPGFKRLLDLVQDDLNADAPNQICLNYLNDQYFTDVLMWYHLAWLGISLRELDPRVKPLMAKQSHFTPEDQRQLILIMRDAVASIIPRYKALLDSGQIEISMTPYGHPIVPLLIDFESMCDAMHDAPKPSYEGYPDGYERAKWHMQHGLEVFENHFDSRPQGIWLSEGAVSRESIGLLDEFAIKWSASGEGVWRHSCEASCINQHDMNSKKALYQPLQLASKNCALFFRDDGLSDLVGFQYKDWHAEDAAADFAHHISNIGRSLGDKVEEHVVSIILDGENAWEYYPDNASHFISALYAKLSTDPKIEMTTFSQAIDDGVSVRNLPVLKAGSWVYGSFSTWIGDKDKNRGWDLLVEAKQCFDKKIASTTLSKKQLEETTQQLAICEGSDWFWWFGDYNPSGSVQDFDKLYRRHLKRLYELLGEVPPAVLDSPISLGGGDMENSGTMRRN